MRPPRFLRLAKNVLGFPLFLGIYAGLLGVVYFGMPLFDFQPRSTQPTKPGYKSGDPGMTWARNTLKQFKIIKNSKLSNNR